MATIDYGVGAPVYVITEDVPELVARWAEQRRLAVPEPGFLRQLLGELAGEVQQALRGGGVEANVHVHGYTEMRAALESRVRGYRARGFMVVAFDRVYYPSGVGISYSPTRAVLWRGNGWHESSYQVAKAGTLPLARQASEVAASWFAADDANLKVLVADDGVFEGSSARRFFAELLGLGVGGAALGSVIGGVSLERFLQRGDVSDVALVVDAVHVYPSGGPEVVDWVCQRDFFAGLPRSGRAVISEPGDTVAIQRNGQPLSAPYWYGSGSLSWASVPQESGERFTRACAAMTAGMFARVADLSHRGPIRCGELAQLPAGICFDPSTLEPGDPEQPFSSAVEEFLQRTFGASCTL